MIKFTILGQACSKANSREIVTRRIAGTDKTRPSVIKSVAAIEFENSAMLQIPAHAKQMLEGNLRVTMTIYYLTHLPDLDESIVLDVLQARYTGKGKDRRLSRKGVYINDRQVREKHIYHGIDKRNPRVEVTVEPIDPQPLDMFGADDPRSPYEKVRDAVLEAWMPIYRNAMPGQLRVGFEVRISPKYYGEVRRTIPPTMLPETLLAQTILGHPLKVTRDQAEDFLIVPI